MSNEMPVMVLGPCYGIFPAVAEVLDSPSGPEYKLFRFKDGKEWPELRHRGYDRVPVKSISVYASHSVENGYGEKLGGYRIIKRLETPPGFFAMFEGTTKPELKHEPAPVASDAALRCEGAILDILEREPRIALRSLKRKTHSERFGEAWMQTLNALAAAGKLRVETEDFGRVWVMVSPETLSGVPKE